MSKRVADKEINQDNWDENEDSEEAGTFQQAADHILKSRVIKTARRRNNATESSGAAKPIFSGFSFTKQPEQESSKPASLHFGNTSKLESTKDNSVPESDKEKCLRDNEFFTQIRSLNKSVSQWIKEHVDKDPICVLTPIFRDYEKHLREIQDKYEKRKESISFNSANSVTDSIKPLSDSDKGRSPDKLEHKTDNSLKVSAEEAKQKSIFGTGSATFSFGNSTTSPPSTLPTAGFSFGMGTPFTFGNAVSNPSSTKESTPSQSSVQEDPDEDEPPKVEFKAVIEEDSIYTIRCKVFIKKDENYVDGGVGNLFLKPVKDRNKMQLIVRADTNLGNLLLNVLLSDSIPTKRMGKNNVMMVCIPTPDKPAPTSILLRVKTSEQADELLEMIDKHKC
ncbi:nuclear pore complex protein Nup50-like [Ctenocephalides felis]|uniref:nuclear pore complex protein Nup50-like n=1 Tax=Ctenocephalides felis TaxID=7515 RepID=UPI000E6E119F|nr:nuclear pore complex protein Nup50-like [Ctenocephalides felis]